MTPTSTRRRVLATTAAACTAALAGCLGARDGPVPEPTVTDDRIDEGWRLVDEAGGEVFEDDVGPITLRALQNTRVYEHVGLAEALVETFDAEGSPVLFFASRIDLRPAIDGLPLGLGRGEVMSEVNAAADRTFRTQLRNAGIEGVERTDETTMEIDSGHTADLRRYTGSFAVDAELAAGNGVTETVSERIEIEGQLAVWHDGTDALISGGVYPTEPVDAVLEDAAVDLSDLVGDDAAAILSRSPAAFEEDVTALMASVE